MCDEDRNHSPTTPAQLKQQITQVMKQPEFRTEKTEQHWKYTGKQTAQPKPGSEPAWLKFLGEIIPDIARVFEGLLWLLLAGIIIWLFIKRKYWLGWIKIKPASIKMRPTPGLFGLDIQPQSLPENITKAAWGLWQDGQQRGALSLLYRGALSHWVTHDQVQLGPNATEGDCMRLFRASSTPDTSNYFCQLTHVWQNTAYAGRLPQTDEMQQLCLDWDVHFGSRV